LEIYYLNQKNAKSDNMSNDAEKTMVLALEYSSVPISRVV
jgi:hypothetical protein